VRRPLNVKTNASRYHLDLTRRTLWSVLDVPWLCRRQAYRTNLPQIRYRQSRSHIWNQNRGRRGDGIWVLRHHGRDILYAPARLNNEPLLA
jgi:hypothetical protein